MTLTFTVKEMMNKMELLTIKRLNNSDFHLATIKGFGYYDNFYVGRTIILNNKKYKIDTIKDRSGLIYTLLLHRPRYNLIYTYDEIDFHQVTEIERESSKKIIIHETVISSVFGFDTAEECLEEFLLLKKLADYERGLYTNGSN